MKKTLLAVVAVFAATPAWAGERTAINAIVAGDLQGAERTLVAERRIFPGRPELMLNLAAVYARTGRTDAARILYDKVLASEPVAMDMRSGSVASSHDVARLGIRRLSTPAWLASR